jgi:hypothetical protein
MSPRVLYLIEHSILKPVLNSTSCMEKVLLYNYFWEVLWLELGNIYYHGLSAARLQPSTGSYKILTMIIQTTTVYNYRVYACATPTVKGPVTLLRMRETYEKRMKINEIIFIRTKILWNASVWVPYIWRTSSVFSVCLEYAYRIKHTSDTHKIFEHA